MNGLTYAVLALVWATMLCHAPREAGFLRFVLGILTGVFVALAMTADTLPLTVSVVTR